jgi:exosortase/archaeosortase family protein
LVALTVPGVAGIIVECRMNGRSESQSEEGKGGLNKVERTLIVAAALLFLTIPLVLTINDMLANAAMATGFDRAVSSIVPFEAGAVGDLLRGFGLPAGNSASSVWIAGGLLPVVAFIDWNCAGWQGFALFGLTSIAGIGETGPRWRKFTIIGIGILGTFAVNVLRILIVVLLGYYVGYPTALLFHDYGGTVLTLLWLLAFWGYVLGKGAEHPTNN